MGTVYRARQTSLGGREVALKVLPDPGREDWARRFRREARVLAELHHPHLVEVYDFGNEQGLLYFAMRLVGGRTLGDVLNSRQGRPAMHDEVRQAVEWIADISGAVAILHAIDLVHRDVKPDNVVLDTAGHGGDGVPSARAVLVDFGLVRSISSGGDVTGHSAATPDYASPEQLLGASVDARSDVFSLGVTLHDLLTGRRPAERPSAALGLEPLTEVTTTPDADLEAVVAKATDPDADWRYADAGALHADLVAWLGGESVSVRQPSIRRRVERRTRERPLPFLIVALVVGVGVTLAVLVWSNAGSENGVTEEPYRGPVEHWSMIHRVDAPSYPGCFLPDPYGSGEYFGTSVAATGDIDGDGFGDLAVGANDEMNRGAVRILFMGEHGEVVNCRMISNAQLSGAPLDVIDDFGLSIALLGRPERAGDGRSVVLAVGAYGDDRPNSDAEGAVYVVELNGLGDVVHWNRIREGESGFRGRLDGGDEFGSALASLGDLDGDGVNDMAVGAHHDTTDVLNQGAVWVLLMNADGTVKHHTKITTGQGGFRHTLQKESLFGTSMAGLGDLDGPGGAAGAIAVSEHAGKSYRGAVWILSLAEDGSVVSANSIRGEKNGDLFGSAVCAVGRGSGQVRLAIGEVGNSRVWLMTLDSTARVHDRVLLGLDEPFSDDGIPRDSGYGEALAWLPGLHGKGVIVAGLHGADIFQTNQGAICLLSPAE